MFHEGYPLWACLSHPYPTWVLGEPGIIFGQTEPGLISVSYWRFLDVPLPIFPHWEKLPSNELLKIIGRILAFHKPDTPGCSPGQQISMEAGVEATREMLAFHDPTIRMHRGDAPEVLPTGEDLGWIVRQAINSVKITCGIERGNPASAALTRARALSMASLGPNHSLPNLDSPGEQDVGSYLDQTDVQLNSMFGALESMIVETATTLFMVRQCRQAHINRNRDTQETQTERQMYELDRETQTRITISPSAAQVDLSSMDGPVTDGMNAGSSASSVTSQPDTGPVAQENFVVGCIEEFIKSNHCRLFGCPSATRPLN